VLSVAVALAVARRPSLWCTAIRQVVRLADRGWWRRRPPLPVPPADYLAFRTATQYGGAGDVPARTVASDVVNYLAWCKRWESEW
jgi:hypothetical protein